MISGMQPRPLLHPTDLRWLAAGHGAAKSIAVYWIRSSVQRV